MEQEDTSTNYSLTVVTKSKIIHVLCSVTKLNWIQNNLDDCLDDECTFPVVAIWHSETVRSLEDEWENDYHYKISHCPFCGEPIEFSVVGEENVDEHYKALKQQREELWKKCNRTDSKKKSEELRKQVQELDDHINWLYELAEYKKVEDENNE